jgi:hypothetical protein
LAVKKVSEQLYCKSVTGARVVQALVDRAKRYMILCIREKKIKSWIGFEFKTCASDAGGNAAQAMTDR